MKERDIQINALVLKRGNLEGANTHCSLHRTYDKTGPVTNRDQFPVIFVALTLTIYSLAHQMPLFVAQFRRGYGEDSNSNSRAGNPCL